MPDPWLSFPLPEREKPLRVGTPLDVLQWAALAEDEPGELVDGYLAEEEVPDALHELAVTWLIHTLRSWLQSGGVVLGSDLKLQLGPRTGRKPDVVLYLPGSPLPSRRGPITTPPDLVVEVVSPCPRDERRDRVEKMGEYASFGVRYYWLVDPTLGSFEIFELVSGRYARAAAATSGALTSVPGCDGLRLDLDALWTELAQLPDE
jgi:Uma2 family endonuclease